MPSFVRKWIKTLDRQAKAQRIKIRRKRADGRRWHLIDTATQLLARMDYDELSIARVTKEAGCSTGAFYLRFPSKEDFLEATIAETLGSATRSVKDELAAERWVDATTEGVIRAIAQEVVQRTGNRRTAGVVRAAIKLGTTRPQALQPLKEYQATVLQCATALVSTRLEFEQPEIAIKEAMQIIFATAVDSVVQNSGPLQAGTRRLRNRMNSLLAIMLDINFVRDRCVADEDGSDEELNRDQAKETEEPPQVPEGYIAVVDPDLQVYRGIERIQTESSKSKRGARKKQAAAPIMRARDGAATEAKNATTSLARPKQFKLI